MASIAYLSIYNFNLNFKLLKIPNMRLRLLIACLLSISAVSWSSPIDSLENALKTAKDDLKVKTLNELFRAYINSDPVKAIGYTREALALATEIDDQKGMAASYNNLGVAYRSQGALDKALEYYLTSLRTYNNLKNKEGIATTKNNIANIYSLKKDHSQAMKYFEESHALFIELGDQPKIIGSLNNLGNLHSDLQLYDQALKYYTQAWDLSEKRGEPFSDPLNNIGNLYYKQGNYPKATEYHQRALELAKKENNNMAILNILASLGEVSAKAGKSKQAQDYLEEALKMSNELQAHICEPQILKSMAGNFYKQGRAKEAYETMVEYDRVKERIYSEESSRKIAQMEVALDIQEREKQLDELKKDDEIKTLQLRNTRMIITSVVLAIVILFAFFNLIFTKRNTKA
jgi:tetratricopeptide (TPR) repeat protein